MSKYTLNSNILFNRNLFLWGFLYSKSEFEVFFSIEATSWDFVKEKRIKMRLILFKSNATYSFEIKVENEMKINSNLRDPDGRANPTRPLLKVLLNRLCRQCRIILRLTAAQS